MARQFRKKPVVIEAVQLSWKTWNEVCEFLHGTGIVSEHTPARYSTDYSDDCGEGWNGPDEQPGPFIALDIPTLEGNMTAKHGDWIIRGINGEFYPCKPDIFSATYEPVE